MLLLGIYEIPIRHLLFWINIGTSILSLIFVILSYDEPKWKWFNLLAVVPLIILIFSSLLDGTRSSQIRSSIQESQVITEADMDAAQQHGDIHTDPDHLTV